MRSWSSREIIKLLKQDGWQVVRIAGSHHQLKHGTKPGTVTVPHPRKTLPIRTVESILRQAGINIKEVNKP